MFLQTNIGIHWTPELIISACKTHFTRTGQIPGKERIIHGTSKSHTQPSQYPSVFAKIRFRGNNQEIPGREAEVINYDLQ